MATLPYAKDELSINIKILNCRNLLIGDTVSSDPYVNVYLGKKLIHKTKHLRNTLNPTFGKKDDNEFDTQFFWGDLTKNGGLMLEVKDWDLVGKDDFLGSVKIIPSEVLKMALTEVPTSYPLEPPPNNKRAKKVGAGTITLSICHTSTTGVKSKYWAPPRASVAARRSTAVNPDDIVTSSDDDSYDSSSSAPAYNKELFIEIVSCKSLIAGDANGLSDPYVKVQMGTRFLHRTAVIKKTLNPAFSAEHKNAFILDCTAKELWEADGIELIVKDHEDGIAALGHTNVELGSAKVSAGRLYQASGMNMKFKITPPKDSKQARRGLPAGSITIRVREATMEDRDEIRDRSNIFKKLGSPKSAAAKKFIPEVDITGIDKKILLVEILSCRELLPADKNGYSDPYILAKLGFKDIHKTRHVNKTLNPVFTAEHRNSFVVNCSVSELFGADGIQIKVIDWDRGVISGDDELGSVQISAQTMYECQEEEYQLDPPPGRNDNAGYVTIRITEISEEQRKQHKKGKLKIRKAPMPPGLSTAESGVSTTSQFSMATTTSQDSNPSLCSALSFRDMPDMILLVEILSCRNLLSADKNGLSDPYVRVKMGGKDLHKTDRVRETVNPIFSSAHNNYFLITCSKSELAGAQGILVRVIDWDRGIGGDDDLGWVQISAESLYECRIQDYPLNAPYGSNEDAGYVTIRTTELSEEERASYSRGKIPFASVPPPPPPPPPSAPVLSPEYHQGFEGSSPTMRKSPNTGVKTMPAHKIDVLLPAPQHQAVLKPPPFDPDAKIIAEEEKKYRFLVTAVVLSSIVLVLLTVTGITGRSARSGDPRVQIEQIGSRNGDPLKTWRGGSCVDIAGWTDSYGYGCDYYNENEGECEAYADSFGINGKRPMDACCVCQNATASCADLDDWVDFFEDSCDWYEENEPIGCPNEGHVNGTNLVLASQACCHCHESNTIRTGDGKWIQVHQESAQTREQFNADNMDINVEAIVGGSVFIILCLCCLFIFCCCCV